MNYRDRLKRAAEERKRKNRRASAAPGSYLTDPTNPGSVYYQHQINTYHADGSYTSESGSGYASRSDTDYGSRESSSYHSGSSDSGSSSYDSGSSGGSYGE